MTMSQDKARGRQRLPLRFALLFMGFLTMGLGIVMTLNAELGVSCWNVLHLGLSYHLPLTVGQATQAVGILIIATAYVLGIKPRLGTWLNMIVVGLAIDLVLWSNVVPIPAYRLWQALLLVGGLALTTLGMCLYMCAGLGAGPRDGLMLGLTLRFRSRVGVVRGLLEVGAMTTGWFLGGPVGLGTVLSAFVLGWFLEVWFAGLLWMRNTVPGMDFLQLPPAFLDRLARKGRTTTGKTELAGATHGHE